MYDLRENEHQELFYLHIDPNRPLPIHIPSPLGRLGYHVFVRLPRQAAARLNDVAARVDVGGLREEHSDMAAGEGVAGAALLPSKAPDLVWRHLFCMQVSRGDGTLVLRGWPADLKQPVDMVICTWPRFVESGMADDWIACQADPRWAPSGVPLGGIGCGRVDLCRDGRFRNFSLNNNQDAHLEHPDGLPGAYLGVSEHGAVVDLATRPVVQGHGACRQLDYTARFPSATLRAAGALPEVDVTVTASGPLCPHDLRRSAIPGFVVQWTLHNRGSQTRTIGCRMGWPNTIGVGGCIASAESGIGYGDGFYHHWDDPTGRREEAIEEAGWAGVRFTGTPADPAAAGEHYLGVRKGTGVRALTQAGGGQGEVCAEVNLPAGASATVIMALAAAMPHWVDSLGVDRGHYWLNFFADGAAVMRTLLAEGGEIVREGAALANLLSGGSLPAWLQTRLSNCNYPLVTNSVLYRDGRFSINEGPTEMAGCYGTIDQRLAAHPATQLLFPRLNATELQSFAAIQAENGGIAHDLGLGHLERKPNEHTWPDLTCSFIIQTARHAWSTGDRDFEAVMWPRAKRALRRHAEWAEAGKGVAQVGEGLGTSYDGYHYIGTTGYMATLWLAALAVMETWARRRGDTTLDADIARWRAAAVARLDADLWNGSHYIAYAKSGGVKRETCHAGQLAGQLYARLLAGTDVLPPARLRACADALLRLNGSEHSVMPPDEAAADGSAATEFCWLPYVEAFMLGPLATLGEARLWPLWERMIAVVDGQNAHPCDTRLMYRPDGERSWGAYYMTAPASWLVYDAWIDFFYDPLARCLRLDPPAPGRYPVVHPLFWGIAEITDAGGTLHIQRVFAAQPPTVASVEIRQGRTHVVRPLAAPCELRPGADVSWER
ncbi:MAG: GH116 family glycosyl hydrolase [Kiritimatiellae bacterium]|nr:GH116 family glycosyl hydrolase [Kiritimatiellia bacterium]